LPGTITIQLFQQLREIVGESTVTFEGFEGTVEELVRWFLEAYPDAAEELLEDGEMSARYMVAVNETVVRRPQWSMTKLLGGDKVAFLTLLGGG